jgi:hypothetical protein
LKIITHNDYDTLLGTNLSHIKELQSENKDKESLFNSTIYENFNGIITTPKLDVPTHVTY